MKKFLLIDGYAMMFRAFYAVKFAPMHNNKPIGAVFGCATTILQAIEQFDPKFLVIAFDAPEKTFRHKMDENYKAQRSKAPDEFIEQIHLVMEMIKTFGISTLIKPGFEADDIIGTLVKKAEKNPIESFILSGDLDFLQLISKKIHLAKFNGKELTGYIWMVESSEPIIYNDEKIEFDNLNKSGKPQDGILEAYLTDGEHSIHIKNIDGDLHCYVFVYTDFNTEEFTKEEIIYPSHKIDKDLVFDRVYELQNNKISKGYQSWQPIVRLFKGFTDNQKTN